MICVVDNQGVRHNVIAVYFADGNGQLRDISELDECERLIWQASRSCYSSGIWFENKPWLENDLWRE